MLRLLETPGLAKTATVRDTAIISGGNRLFTVTFDGRLNKVFKVGVALFALGVVIIGIAAIFFWGSPNFSFMAACAAALFSVATLNFALSVRTNRRVEV